VTFTYDGLLGDDLQKVRHLTRDTIEDDAFLTDEEIRFHLEERGDIYLAAADACEVIATKLGREMDRSAIGLSASPVRSADFYLRIAGTLRAQVTKRAQIFVGGLSIDAKSAMRDNDDLVQPSFSVGQDDHPGTGDDADDTTREQ